MESKENIIIIGKEYFDSINGNSYHTSEVFVDGNMIGKSNVTYGYGDHYQQTAIEVLKSKGYLKDLIQYKNGGSEALYQYCDRKGIKLITRKIEGLKRKQL